MRPCTELNPCDGFRKYAGLLLEQPMPDSLMTRFGIDAHLEERVDDALGDRVVPAPGAERRLAAAIAGDVEVDAVRASRGSVAIGKGVGPVRFESGDRP